MQFYLGTHQPHWLKDDRFADVPLFVSRRTLNKLVTKPEAVTPFALDSGGFTELQMYGRWTIDTDQYVEEIGLYIKAYGRRLHWVAPQDWMCEPLVISGGMGRRGHRNRQCADLGDVDALQRCGTRARDRNPNGGRAVLDPGGCLAVERLF